MWMGVGCPCPPVCNDNVTPRHLFIRKLAFHKCKEEKKDNTKSYGDWGTEHMINFTLLTFVIPRERRNEQE